MRKTKSQVRQEAQADDSVTVGCLVAYVIEEARRRNCLEMASRLDDCLNGIMQDMDKDARMRILMASYDLMTADLPREAPSLRLVYSRD
jgi:hypothetical protein